MTCRTTRLATEFVFPVAGEKKYEAQNPDVVSQVEDVLQHRTAGDPMRDDIKFTDQTPTEISRAVNQNGGTTSPLIVRRILKTLGFGRRKN